MYLLGPEKVALIRLKVLLKINNVWKHSVYRYIYWSGQEIIIKTIWKKKLKVIFKSSLSLGRNEKKNQSKCVL